MPKYSKQRECVRNILNSTTEHPTAEWIHGQCKKHIPNISLGTVYRNLSELESAGNLMKVPGVFDKCRYDGNSERHTHFVCNICGAVYDVNVSVDTEAMLFDTQFEHNADDYALTYYGTCLNCLKLNKIKKEI